MTRVARLDTPGLLHHCMHREIGRSRILNEDRENLIERLSILIPKTNQRGEKTAKEEDCRLESLKFEFEVVPPLYRE